MVTRRSIKNILCVLLLGFSITPAFADIRDAILDRTQQVQLHPGNLSPWSYNRVDVLVTRIDADLIPTLVEYRSEQAEWSASRTRQVTTEWTVKTRRQLVYLVTVNPRLAVGATMQISGFRMLLDSGGDRDPQNVTRALLQPITGCEDRPTRWGYVVFSDAPDSDGRRLSEYPAITFAIGEISFRHDYPLGGASGFTSIPSSVVSFSDVPGSTARTRRRLSYSQLVDMADAIITILSWLK